MVDDNVILEAALIGLQAERARLELAMDEIRGRINGDRTNVRRGRPSNGTSTETATTETTAAPRKRHMTEAGRKRIAAAAKRRWAKLRAEGKARSASA